MNMIRKGQMQGIVKGNMLSQITFGTNQFRWGRKQKMVHRHASEAPLFFLATQMGKPIEVYGALPNL
jgi:hypothetical protein